MFAAKAGAEHVYGIDMSGIVEQAKNIVEKNGLADKVSSVPKLFDQEFSP